MTDFTEHKVAAMIPVSTETLGDRPSRIEDRIYAGYAVFGPTQPREVWTLPEWDEDASPEWKTLYEIASECPDPEECGCADTALRAIGVHGWKPGPKPGWRPGLAEALRQTIALRTDPACHPEET